MSVCVGTAAVRLFSENELWSFASRWHNLECYSPIGTLSSFSSCIVFHDFPCTLKITVVSRTRKAAGGREIREYLIVKMKGKPVKTVLVSR